MAYIAKLVCNRLGWTVPSGLDAKSDNFEYGPFEAQVHFGFEEWLFNETHSIELEDGRYYFGFVECFRNNRNFNPISRLDLFTTLYPNFQNPEQVQTSRHIGYLSGVERISETTYNLILTAHPGIAQRMRDELSISLVNDPVLHAALIEFDQAAIDRELFNCLYLRRNRRNPPREGQNYDYINIPRGPQKHLPGNFQLTEISQSVIDELENNERIPQVD
jgi:hypothetical protein